MGVTHSDVDQGSATRRLLVGGVLGVVSAATFSWSGPLGRVLYDQGWSTGAVVNLRLGGAAALLIVPTLLVLARHPQRAAGWLRTATVYGLIAMAAMQVTFFMAVAEMSPALALLIEYQGPVVLLAWTWWRTGQAPPGRVLAGAAVAVAGLVAILGVGDVHATPAGVAWACGSALCIAAYFHLGKRADQPPHLVMVGAGQAVAALAVGAVSLLGVLPVSVDGAGAGIEGAVPWWVAALGLVVVASVIAYGTGVAAITMMGPHRASFLGLSEVLFAALWGALLLGERPTPLSLVGVAVVLAGVALVQAGSDADAAEPVG